MAKERAPRRRRRWFLLALLVGAVTWYMRSRAAARSLQRATLRPAPPPAPVPAPHQTTIEPDRSLAPAESGLDIAAELPVAAEPVAPEPIAPEPIAAEPIAAEPVAAEPVDDGPVVAEQVAAEPSTPPPAEVAPPASAGVQPALFASEAAEPVLVEPVAPDAEVAPETPTAATPSPRPRPRPRPRPDGGTGAGTQVETPPAGSAWADGPAGEDTPSSGFGPTSATPAPEHALFTPASTDGVGAGAVPGPEGEAPAPEYTIKGNAGSMVFHTPASPYYERIRAEVWFRTADEAVAAGFTEWRSHRRTR